MSRMAWLLPLGLAALAGCSRTPTSVSIETTQPAPGPTGPTGPAPAPDPQQRAAHLFRSQENLRHIGFAFKLQNGQFPAGFSDDQGKPLLSWRVALLPALGHDDLYRQFKYNEPWDSEHNKKLLGAIPSVYRPVRGEAAPGHTYYRVFTGAEALFPAEVKVGDTITLLHGQRCYPMASPLSAAQLTDGADRTLLVVEGGEAVPWTKPDELTYEKGKPLPKLGGMFEGDFNALFSDTVTVRLLPASLKEDLIRAAVTPTGGEKLEPASFGKPEK